MKHKRTCSKCKSPIAKHHRWHTVYHKFLWFTWATQEHRDCQKPTEIHKRVVRLKGEVPLPFDSVGAIWTEKDVDAKNFGMGFDGGTAIKTPIIYKNEVN